MRMSSKKAARKVWRVATSSGVVRRLWQCSLQKIAVASPVSSASRGGAEAGAHRGDVGFGVAAEGGAEGIALRRVEGVGGEAGVVEGAAEARVEEAAAGQRRPVGGEEVLERGGPGFLGSDQEDRASAHRSGPFSAREATSAGIDGR